MTKPQRYGVSSMPCDQGIYILHKDYLALIERCADIAECYDMGTIEGHEIAGLIRALKEQE